MKITIDENDSITVELDNGHVQKFPECWQEDCVKAAVQKEKAEALELRCEELEQELRDAQAQMDEYIKEGSHRAAMYSKLQRELRDTQEKLDKQEDSNERIIAARDELRKQREALMKRIGELEQELRDAQGQLDESVRKEAQLGLEYNKLRDRIWEQNRTIARYDDENRVLKERLSKCGEKPFPVSMNEWAECIHRIAVDHGWWETDEGACDDGERPLPEILMLCVTELAEAMEEYRNGNPLAYQVQSYGIVEGRVEEDPAKWFPASKPEGIAIEMLDCVIRILDWMGHNGVDVDELIRKKYEYNKTRPYRHGGKKA